MNTRDPVLQPDWQEAVDTAAIALQLHLLGRLGIGSQHACDAGRCARLFLRGRRLGFVPSPSIGVSWLGQSSLRERTPLCLFG